jgi:hypothetical protein
MSDHAVNHAIERVMTSRTLFGHVLEAGPAALDGCGLSEQESAEIAGAVAQDARAADPTAFAALRRVARFDHLFGAAAATATKSG